jgi:phosphoribosylformylglycinamidine cyclo-ligase
VFDWLQKGGQVTDNEMHRVFNCGIGMAVVVAEEHVVAAVDLLQRHGEIAQRIGRIVARLPDAPATVVI